MRDTIQSPSSIAQPATDFTSQADAQMCMHNISCALLLNGHAAATAHVCITSQCTMKPDEICRNRTYVICFAVVDGLTDLGTCPELHTMN